MRLKQTRYLTPTPEQEIFGALHDHLNGLPRLIAILFPFYLLSRPPQVQPSV
jgi:hypothetical protein